MSRRRSRAFPRPRSRPGRPSPNWSRRTSESSRSQAIHNAAAGDDGDGAPYRVLYRLAPSERAICAVEDFGRWFADAHGRPARAHGVLRILQRSEDPQFRSRRRDVAPVATARARAGEISTRRSNSRFAHARPGEKTFAVLIVGVENLAELNRRHGYEATDEVIAMVGRRLGANMRAIDEVAHYAGGKFAVLLSAESPEQLVMAAPRLARRVNAEPFETAIGAGAGFGSHRRGARAPARPQRLSSAPARRRGI